MSESARLFIAVDISKQARAEVDGLIVRLAALDPTAHWTPAENLHYTLHFLGAQKQGFIEKAKQALQALCRNERAFEIRPSGLGCFGPPRNPNLLWIGAEPGATELGRLSLQVAGGLKPLGFRPENRPFTAHMTIARASRAGLAPALVNTFGLESFISQHPFEARQITLYESLITPSGPIYNPIELFNLEG